mmetsp:Transcript_30626/g.85782  ORF Transcript_30626/g.85782 Transcript_30626/m.85782 type:complete len:241 (-) Transcript_30626:101-823(-)
MLALAATSKAWSLRRHTLSLTSSATASVMNSRKLSEVLGTSSFSTSHWPALASTRLKAYRGSTSTPEPWMDLSIWRVRCRPPRPRDRTLFCNTYPSCTAEVRHPSWPMSTTSAVGRPMENADSTGDLARKTAGDWNFSKSSSTVFSRASRGLSGASARRMGCSTGSTRRRSCSTWCQVASKASQSFTTPPSTMGFTSMCSRRYVTPFPTTSGRAPPPAPPPCAPPLVVASLPPSPLGSSP